MRLLRERGAKSRSLSLSTGCFWGSGLLRSGSSPAETGPIPAAEWCRRRTVSRHCVDSPSREPGAIRCGMFQVHPAGFIEPCLPTPSRTVPGGGRWAFEVKHDEFRFMCRRDGDRVRVFSRNGRDWADKVPAIVDAILAMPVKSATIDSEGVVVDQRGLTDFERLRSALA